MTSIDTVIVGAGPYGLSIAAHLKEAGIPYKVFGTPMESWRTFMPVGMVLKSEQFASNLWDPKRKYTLKKYCELKGIPYQAHGKPLANSLFLEYANWFKENAVGETTDVKVTHVAQGSKRYSDGFTVKLANGETVECRQVILATGHMAFQQIPTEFSSLKAPQFYHAALLHQLDEFKGRDVTIIGAGQSALETAALMNEAGARVRILVRQPELVWNPPSTDVNRSTFEKMLKPEAGLGAGWRIVAICELPRVFRFLFPAEKRHRFVAKSWGPSGAAWLKNRVLDKVEIQKGTKVLSTSMVDGRVLLKTESLDASKSEIMTDHVIAGTGYKVDLDRVAYIDADLKKKIAREGNAPALDSRFETSVPGLFIVGIASSPTFGPVMRFMFGAKHAGPILVRRLKSRGYKSGRRSLGSVQTAT